MIGEDGKRDSQGTLCSHHDFMMRIIGLSKKSQQNTETDQLGLVSLFNDISTFVDYLMPEPSSKKNKRESI